MIDRMVQETPERAISILLGRNAELEQQVEALKAEIATLKATIEELERQK